ncbi:DUF2970 domain-containing protein [Simplicispira suum]|uniref:DUF2970 domain-containing protein n=1 Tax=Simplicispira suum TaxID=2109915 RepID=A0A2S0N183_9BURK|nr:DUF2970 domain-containing protein [Simplicispira suum]AVO41908.1 hypothetical protein C6571_12005 [Simplicispira suum]MBW7832751.1 DUF2970 domain-containing protein [Simplicispira suum]
MSEAPNPKVRSSAEGGSFLRSMKAVAWAFLGLRKRSEYQQDLEQIHPLHIIAAGLLGFLLIVVSLVALVHWVV